MGLRLAPGMAPATGGTRGSIQHPVNLDGGRLARGRLLQTIRGLT